MGYNAVLSFVVKGLYDAIAQKTELFFTTTVKTSNFALNIFIYSSEGPGILRLDPAENLRQCETKYIRKQNI